MAKAPKAATFAHLMGIRAESDTPTDTDDERKRKEGESDEDYDKRMEELDKKEEEAAAAESGDGEDEEDKKKEQAARKAERARCEKIFSSKAATGRPDVAAHLAFKTSMSADEAIALMATITAGAPKGSGLSQRMASIQVPALGTEGGEQSGEKDTAAAIASKIVASANKARGVA